MIKPPLVHNTDETLELILTGTVTVRRFGDGEFALMNGHNLLFQPYSKDLSNRLEHFQNMVKFLEKYESKKRLN